jgi:hypothetical protein
VLRGLLSGVFLAIGATGSHVAGDAEAFMSWDDAEPRKPSEVPLPERIV